MAVTIGDLTFYTKEDFPPCDKTESDATLEWVEQDCEIEEDEGEYQAVEEFCEIDWTYNWDV